MKLIITLFLSLVSYIGYSQSKVTLASQFHNGDVILRWGPADHDTWSKGMNQGYKVLRYTLQDNGQPLTTQQVEQSMVVIKDNIYPLSQSDWNNTSFENSDLAQVGYGLLYSEELNPSFIPSSFEEIVTINNTKSNRFTFTLVVADQNLEVAEALGLGCVDSNANSKNQYSYQIQYADNNSSLTGCIINLPTAQELSPVEDIRTVSGDKMIAIEWNAVNSRLQYTSYNIERSSDGINFQKVNDAPFIYGSDKNSLNSQALAYYLDSIPSNDITYYYRVVGKSPFGFDGPSSQAVSGKGTPGRMNISLSIALPSQEEDQVTIIWGGYTADQISDIENIDVYKSSEIYGNYQIVNTSPITPDNFSYIDNNPSSEGYYMVTMVDKNGHHYKSRAVLSQPLDRTPPPVPTGLFGDINDQGEVSIGWSGTTEDDLSGYRVFRSNLRYADFIDISNYDVEENSFTEIITTEMLMDTIFYRVKSSDIRGNHSEYSEILALARPNTLPPSAPLLHKVFPTPEGVKLAWKYSSSSDVVFHILERKPRDRAGWDTVLKIEVGSPQESQTFGEGDDIFNFLDASELDAIAYQYRLVAEDLAGLRSLSNLIEITPFYSNIHGSFVSSDFRVDCSQVGNSENQQQLDEINNTITQINNNPNSASAAMANLLASGSISYSQYAAIINGTNTGESFSTSLSEMASGIQQLGTEIKCEVLLTYEVKQEEQIRYIELIRDPIITRPRTIQSIPFEEIIFFDQFNIGVVDKTATKDKTYEYKILIHYANGMISPMSDGMKVTVTE